MLQSNHHHQQTNVQFFTGRMPFLSPNQQCQSTEGNIISHSMDLLTHSSPGVFQLCLWPLIAHGYLGGGLPCRSSALWCQYPNHWKLCITYKRVKCAILHYSVGGVLISLPKAVSPLVVIPLLSVTRGQCDARPTVTFPAYAGTKFILLGDSWLPRILILLHMCLGSLDLISCPGPDSNPGRYRWSG